MLFKTLAPLHDFFLGQDSSYQFAPDVILSPIPEWLRENDFTNGLSRRDQVDLTNCTHCVVSECETDDLSSQDPLSDEPRSIRAAKIDSIYLMNLALWLMRLCPIGFTFVFHVRESVGTFTIQEYARHDRFLYHENDDPGGTEPSIQDLETAGRLYASLRKVPRHSALWTACRAVTSALQMQRNEIRHLLLWIALEALFGVESSGEIRYRLSQRLAFFIAPDRHEAARLFAEAKRGYDVRCKVAHGHWGKNTRDTDDTGRTENFVRRALVHLLSDDEITKKFCGSGRSREEYLDNLVFTFGVESNSPL